MTSYFVPKKLLPVTTLPNTMNMFSGFSELGVAGWVTLALTAPQGRQVGSAKFCQPKQKQVSIRISLAFADLNCKAWAEQLIEPSF
jgi:hypothetical protein